MAISIIFQGAQATTNVLHLSCTSRPPPPFLAEHSISVLLDSCTAAAGAVLHSVLTHTTCPNRLSKRLLEHYAHITLLMLLLLQEQNPAAADKAHDTKQPIDNVTTSPAVLQVLQHQQAMEGAQGACFPCSPDKAAYSTAGRYGVQRSCRIMCA